MMDRRAFFSALPPTKALATEQAAARWLALQIKLRLTVDCPGEPPRHCLRGNILDMHFKKASRPCATCRGIGWLFRQDVEWFVAITAKRSVSLPPVSLEHQPDWSESDFTSHDEQPAQGQSVFGALRRIISG